MRVVLFLCALLAVPGHARAGDEAEATRLTMEGVKLADGGRFDEAIEMFRRAEQLSPRAIHDCNIGLAYARSDRPAQADFFLRRCRARAAGQLPAWVDARTDKIDAALRAGKFAQVEITADPPGTVVTIASFLPDDLLSVSGPVWLPFGSHQITAAKPGLPPERRTVRVESVASQSVRFSLAAETTEASSSSPPRAVETAANVHPPAPGARSPLKLAGIITAGAGLVLVGGGVYFFSSARQGFDDIQEVADRHEAWSDEKDDIYDRAEADELRGKVFTAAGAAVLLAGGALFYFGVRADERAQRAPQLAATPVSGGAAIQVTCEF